MIYTPPGQQGFDQPVQATEWLRGTPQLTATLTRLGLPAAIVIAVTALWLHRRPRPAAGRQ